MFMVPAVASAQDPIALNVPLIVPITGLLALEGSSQLHGAQMAIAHAPPGLKVESEVVDSGTAADGGANALERVADRNFGLSHGARVPSFVEQRCAAPPLCGSGDQIMCEWLVAGGTHIVVALEIIFRPKNW